jgi:hypothetical protein
LNKLDAAKITEPNPNADNRKYKASPAINSNAPKQLFLNPYVLVMKPRLQQVLESRLIENLSLTI